jgi:mRNA interferase MazF
MYKRGSIVLIPFPFSDLSGLKVRPALVLSTDAKGSDMIVVFVTSKLKLEKSITVTITPSAINGLKTMSQVVCTKIATLDKKVCLGQIGTLESANQKEVDRQIKKAIGL